MPGTSEGGSQVPCTLGGTVYPWAWQLLCSGGLDWLRGFSQVTVQRPGGECFYKV